MSTSVQTLRDSEFYRAFAGRVRETLAGGHTRTAEQASPVTDTATTHRSVDAYLGREYPALFPVAEPAADEQPVPRTWSFTDRYSGEVLTVTCMVGCIADHSRDISMPKFPDDNDVYLPITEGPDPEPFRVLSACMYVRPFADRLAERLPHMSVEVLDDHHIESLDPDGYETVIRVLQERINTMRVSHAQLVRVRAEYARRAR